eukprot:403338722
MENQDKKSLMEYRYLGSTGIKVSAISFGNMVNHYASDPQSSTNEIIQKCLEWGINFFDTAESYSAGMAEVYLGQAFKDLNVRREDVVVTTKLYFGTDDSFGKMACPQVNAVGLSRKHIIEGTKASLQRLQMNYVDVIYAHRYDDDVPLEETCRAFSWVIEKGYAFYWGTSEWNQDQIVDAIQYCRAHGLHEPVTEQPQYNMLVRDRFEKEYESVFSKFGYGSTVWSPLASGILSGRYNDGNIPEDSRMHQDFRVAGLLTWRYFGPKKEGTVKMLKAIEALSQELGYTQAQVAIAWALASKDVSTLILGFSKVSYVDENLKALELYKKWTPEIEKKIEAILGNGPQPTMSMRSFKFNKTRRHIAVFEKQ